MNWPEIPVPKMSDHGSEILLFGMIAAGVLGLLGIVAWRHVDGWDVAACLLVLQGIINAVKDRWTQRGTDRMAASLANAPPSDPPAPSPDGPLSPAPDGDPAPRKG